MSSNDILIPGACVESVKALKDGERGRLWLAVIEYQCECKTPSLPGGERYLWPEFKAAIDKQRAEEVALRLARAQGGKLGGRPKKAEGFEKNLKVSERNAPLSPPLPLSPTPPISNPPIIPPKENTLAQREAEFDAFWEAYPKKVGKKPALKSFLKTKVPLQTLLDALERQKQSKEWQDKQYIPHASTWLNQERWEDEVTPIEQPEEPKNAPRFVGTEIIDGEEVAIFERT